MQATETQAQSALMLPIAEQFISPQGEGEHTGRLMYFVRLAGCTVGKPFMDADEAEKHNALHVYQEKCTTYDGRTFACDTNFKMSAKLSVDDLCDKILASRIKHVCLTGGEPLMHKNIAEVIKQLSYIAKVHIETSGTIPIGMDLALETALRNSWVAISPKQGFRDEYMFLPSVTNEVKILVDEHFDWYKLPLSIRHNPKKVFLQPINYENAINYANVQLIKELQMRHPQVRISMQMHKIIGVR